MHYRRVKAKGASYFFTVNLAQRNKSILIDNIDLLRQVFKRVQKRHPFKIEAIVILPEHLHTIWTLPEGDNDYPTRWMLIKSAFPRQLPKTESRNKSRLKKAERGIWQRRYWEHLIRNDKDFSTHMNYIHFNPVKHGHVKCAVDWPYSSIHQCIEKSVLESNWGCDGAVEFDGFDFGEM